MTEMIQAIETTYADCRFRSRLEARWAVFFDTLGVRWEYEPEGYEVGYSCQRYLPDFWLPITKTWVEVKGDPQKLNWDLLADALDYGVGLPETHESSGTTRGILLLGSVPRVTGLLNTVGIVHPLLQHHKGCSAEYMKFTEGGGIEVNFTHEYGLGAGGSGWSPGTFLETTRLLSGACYQPGLGRSREVTNAYLAARRARFEWK